MRTLASTLGLTKKDMLDLFERENQRGRQERAAVREANKNEQERAKCMADVEKEKLSQENEFEEFRLRLAKGECIKPK